MLEMAAHSDPLRPCCNGAEIHRVLFLRLEGDGYCALHSSRTKVRKQVKGACVPESRTHAPNPGLQHPAQQSGGNTT